MTTVLGICSALVTVAGKWHTLYVTISTSGYDGWLQQRDCHGIDAVWTRRAARDCSGVDVKGVNNFRLWSRISPETIDTSKIGKVLDQLHFIPYLVKKWWIVLSGEGGVDSLLSSLGRYCHPCTVSNEQPGLDWSFIGATVLGFNWWYCSFCFGFEFMCLVLQWGGIWESKPSTA